MRSQKSFKWVSFPLEPLFVIIFSLITLIITGCSKPLKPDHVYCLISSDDEFYDKVRKKVRVASDTFKFSYFDTSKEIIRNQNEEQNFYDSRRIIDLLVKDNERYVLMLNNIGEERGSLRISIFSRHDKNIEDFSETLKHSLLSGNLNQPSVILDKCRS